MYHFKSHKNLPVYEFYTLFYVTQAKKYFEFKGPNLLPYKGLTDLLNACKKFIAHNTANGLHCIVYTLPRVFKYCFCFSLCVVTFSPWSILYRMSRSHRKLFDRNVLPESAHSGSDPCQINGADVFPVIHAWGWTDLTKNLLHGSESLFWR
jgi:hypothetical protein